MNEYLLSVMGTVLVCSLLTALAPEGKTSAVIKGVTRLACVLVIISPVLQFFKTGELEKNTNEIFIESGIRTDEEFIQYYSERRIRETERALCKELEESFVPVTDVTLKWSLTDEPFGKFYSAEYIRIEGITVHVPNTVSEEVKQEMCSYLTKNYCSEVLIE